MSNKNVAAKIAKDIAHQGYSCVKGLGWYFTVGMGAKGRKEIIMPATVNYIAFQSLVDQYFRGKVEIDKKFINEQVIIKTELMLEEPGRFVLRKPESKSQDLYRQVLTSGLIQEPFEGFLTFDTPDNDNRLFGENTCLLEMSSADLLTKMCEQLLEQKQKEEAEKEAQRKADEEHAKKVLERNKPLPLNRPKAPTHIQPKPNYTKRIPRIIVPPTNE